MGIIDLQDLGNELATIINNNNNGSHIPSDSDVVGYNAAVSWGNHADAGYLDSSENIISTAVAKSGLQVETLSDVASLTSDDIEVDSYVRVANIGAILKRVASGGVVLGDGISFTPLPIGGVVYGSHFGVTGNGSDERQLVQNAINAAIPLATAAEAAVHVDLEGMRIGIGSPIDMTLADYVRLVNGALIAVGTGWDAANDYMLNCQSPDPMREVGLERLNIDCDHKCSGIICKNMQDGLIDTVHVMHMSIKGIYASVKNGGLRGRNITVNQFFWGETGFDLTANRTAIGIHVDCPDTMWSQILAYYCWKPIYTTDGTTQWTDIHPYNGALSDGVDAINIHIDGARGQDFDGLYLDNGIILITGDGSADEFNHYIDGFATGSAATATGNHTCYVRLEAIVPNENAAGLKIELNARGLVAQNSIDFVTSGSGTWDEIEGKIEVMDRLGTQRIYGSLVFPDGTEANPGIVGQSEGDRNTGFWRPAGDELAYSANGSGVFKMGTSGIAPFTNNTKTLGTSSSYWNSIYSNNMTIVDGVATPGAVSGFARLYVDAADGDLKIRFGDGTIKTIVTDTP